MTTDCDCATCDVKDICEDAFKSEGAEEIVPLGTGGTAPWGLMKSRNAEKLMDMLADAKVVFTPHGGGVSFPMEYADKVRELEQKLDEGDGMRVSASTYYGWVGEMRKEFEAVCIELLEEFKTDVMLSCPGGRPVNPPDYKTIRIYFDSGLGGQAINRTAAPPKLYGVKHQGMSVTSEFKGTGKPIYTDEGVIIGEVVNENALFIYPSLTKHATEASVRIFRKILETFVFYKKGGAAPKLDPRIVMKGVILRTLGAQQAEIKKDIENAGKNIKSWQENITKTVRNVRDFNSRLKAFEGDESELLDKTLSAIDNISKMEGVKDVEVDHDGGVKVKTGLVEIPHEGSIYEIGEFELRLQSNGHVYMKNLTNKKGSDGDHPHVADEDPCLGNISHTLPKLIGDFRYDVAVSVVLEFLKSYNPQSPLRRIGSWEPKKETK